MRNPAWSPGRASTRCGCSPPPIPNGWIIRLLQPDILHAAQVQVRATKQQTTHNFPIEVFVAHETHDASSSEAPLACEQSSSKVGEIPLAALYALADFPCLLFTFCQIGFYLPPMTQVVGDDSVDIGQRRGGIAFRDGFRGRPVLESANHQLQ